MHCVKNKFFFHYYLAFDALICNQMSNFAIVMLYGNYHFDQNVHMWSLNFILGIKNYAS